MSFTFFSSAHGTFSRIDHILGHKSSLGKFKKIEIIPRIFSDHNAVRLDLNYRRKTVKNSNIWRLNNTLLNDQQITEEIKMESQINIYAANIGVPQDVRQVLTSMKGEINNNTITVGNFNTPLTPMDRSTKQKINKETQTLNDTIDQLDLIDIYRTFRPKTMNFTFFSSAHGTFSRIDHILVHKSRVGKLKRN